MRIAKVDRNQTEIVRTLRQSGCIVAHTHMVGGGFPDLCVNIQNRTYLIEVKDGLSWKSKQKLTHLQVDFHARWGAKIPILTSVDDAITFVNQARLDNSK